VPLELSSHVEDLVASTVELCYEDAQLIAVLRNLALQTAQLLTVGCGLLIIWSLDPLMSVSSLRVKAVA